MKIAILGTGHVGGALGRRWSEKGHEVFFGSRAPAGEKTQALKNAGHIVTDIQSAVDAADVILLAVPWHAAEETIKVAGEFDGKVLIDCSNPLNSQFDGLELGFTTSAAEMIDEWASTARVVKAFNTISVATMIDPLYEGKPATVFYCGDDDDAKAIVHQLAADLGLEPVHAGPLKLARQIEPLAMLYIHLAVREGWGSNCAFKIMKRPKPTAAN